MGHYKIKCSIGKRGIRIKKKEGDKITPKGKFKIKRILYRKDRIPTLNTKINKTIINKNMGWCDDPKSKFYNKLIKFPFKYSAENLFRKDKVYDIILVLNFNTNPIVIGKGSAIFIHIAKKNYSKTLGCVAISKYDMKKILKKINKKTTVKIN
jgi:L,D-peptidoglycan transpeptidase YkuD (ErfK/YbiS/YcfS/YnhG family)